MDENLEHRHKRLKTFHVVEETEEAPAFLPALSDEQWLQVLQLVWAKSTPVTAAALEYFLKIKGLNWMLEQAKECIKLPTAHAILAGLIVKTKVTQTATQLCSFIQEANNMTPQLSEDVMCLTNPFTPC